MAVIAGREMAPSELSVGVVGLGPVGAVAMQLAVRAGFKVTGYDRDLRRIDQLREATPFNERLRLSHEATCLEDADVVIVAVRIAVDAAGVADLDPIRKVAADLNVLPEKERLVLLESTVPPGTTRRFTGHWLQLGGKHRCLVAHCPERLKVGDSVDDVLRMPRLVGGIGPEATQAACEFLGCLGVRAVAVSAPEVSELSKLLENAFLTVGIGLVGEITRLSHALSVNGAEVAKAAATKTDGYLPFWPGAGIGGHCLPNDLLLLREAASRAGVTTPLLDGASVSTGMLTSAVVDRLESLLEAQGKRLENNRIWVIGIGFKVGSSDLTGSSAAELIRQLRRKGAHPVYTDSNNAQFDVDNVPVQRVPPNTYPEDAVGAVILAGDASIHLSELDTKIPLILDAGGARIMSGNSPRMRSL